MALLSREPLLRALAAAKLSHKLFLNVVVAVMTLYLLRELSIEPVQLGLRATMAVGAVGMVLSIGWLVWSPIPRLRGIPTGVTV